MAVATDQQIKRDDTDGLINAVGVAANRNLHQGTFCFADPSGFATDVKCDASTTFLGITRHRIRNTSPTHGLHDIEFWVDGVFELPASGLAPEDVGSPIYAVDNYTLTKDPTGNPQVGTITEVLSASLCKVEIQGLAGT